MRTRIHNLIMDKVVAVLNQDTELVQSGCRAIAQNDQEIATLVQIEIDKLEGLALVVAVNAVRKIHSNPIKWSIEFSVSVSEFVPLRDTRSDFVTAIDAAMAAGELIDESGLGRFDSLSHTTPGNGILEAIANCSGEFTFEQ